MVRTPFPTSAMNRSLASPLALRRAFLVRSTNGGFHKAKVRGPCGEPSSVITLALSPVSSSKCSAGLAMVAEVAMNVGAGLAPALGDRKGSPLPSGNRRESPIPWYSAHTRRSRRSTHATCDPKTPR